MRSTIQNAENPFRVHSGINEDYKAARQTKCTWGAALHYWGLALSLLWVDAKYGRHVRARLEDGYEDFDLTYGK